MKQQTVNSRFLWVGNWSAVDFVNTDIVLEGKPVDLLAAPADLTAWLSEAGVYGPDKVHASRAKQQEIFRKAKAYRALLRAGLVEVTCKRALPIDLLKTTNAMLAEEKPVERLAQSVTGYQLLKERKLERPASFIAPIAESFAKLLVEGDPGRLRKCRNEECVLYFYDTSKSGTRSWCSLEICGNKMRMAASRERHRA